MKIYIQQVDGSWSHTAYREDFENLPKAEYNAQGWYDFEPTPQPAGELNSCSIEEPPHLSTALRQTTHPPLAISQASNTIDCSTHPSEVHTSPTQPANHPIHSTS